MMGGSMDSMMSGMMGFGWLAVLIAVALVIGGVVLLVKLLTPAGAPGAGGIGNIILAVLAVIGGVALVAVLAMGTMHFGIMR
jgi:hypothetical protein